MDKDTENIILPEKELEDTYIKLVNLFKEKNICYKLYEHEPVKTSEEAAIIRNTSLESGAKAILINVDSKYFCLMVMSAAYKFNNKLVKKILNSKNIKFASIQDVWSNTKCFNGAVPPFGKLFEIKTYVDKSLINQGDYISFNGGLRTKSFVIDTKDYIKIEEPIICEFCDIL